MQATLRWPRQAPAGALIHHECHRPERTTLYRLVQQHAATSFAEAEDAGGRVVLKLKTPWHDGATHLLMSPLEFMHRPAALVPRPRLHLIRIGVGITFPREVSGPPLSEHGVLAPSAKLRAMVVPQ